MKDTIPNIKNVEMNRMVLIIEKGLNAELKENYVKEYREIRKITIPEIWRIEL